MGFNKVLVCPEGAVTMCKEEQEYLEGGAKRVYDTISVAECELLADGLATMGTGIAEGTAYCSSVIGVPYRILLYCFSALTLSLSEFFRRAANENGAIIYEEDSNVNGTINPSVGSSYSYSIEIDY